jgi:hypothetical protein
MKRPPSPDDGKGQLSEKKLRRLEKNRLSARECRRRKREATENLQREINVLEGENLRLRLQLQIGEEAEESLNQEQEKLTEGLTALLKSGASEAEVYTKIEEYKEKFADYGRDRRSAIEFHLRNVERLLMPTKTTSVAMRALHGGSAPAATVVSPATSADSAAPVDRSVLAVDTANPALQPKAMFQYLVNYLEVTPEQAAALKDSRWVAQELDESLIKALSMSKELRTRLTQCGKDLEAEFNTVRSILTPTQAAKFLVWVANNSACMHMLNELWSRVYPQPSESAGAEGESKNNEGDSST